MLRLTKSQLKVAIPKELKPIMDNLSSFDQKFRNRGLHSLQKYLGDYQKLLKVAHDYPLLIIWKKLMLAMIQQEDPLKQEKLAEEIAKLVKLFRKDAHIILFHKTAIMTFAMQWGKHNNFQTSKIMMFFRVILRHVLFALAERDWRFTQALVDMWEAEIIQPTDYYHTLCKPALKTHMADILLEEISKTTIFHAGLTYEILFKFLVPYMKVLTMHRDVKYRSAVKESVFVYLCRQSDAGVAAYADLTDKEMPEDMVEEFRAKRRELLSIVYPEKNWEKNSKKKGKANKNEVEEAMKKILDEELQNKQGDSDSEDHAEDSDDESMDGLQKELDGQGKEDEGSEDEFGGLDEDTDEESGDDSDDENDTDKDSGNSSEESGAEEEGEVVLDPRAGDVDVVLPQLPVDFELLAEWVFKMYSAEGLNKKQRMKLGSLYRLIKNVIGGVFQSHHPLVAPELPVREDVDEVTMREAVRLREELLESELSRFQVPSKKIAERKSEKLEHEKSVSLKVSKVLNQEKGKLHQLKRKKDEERQTRKNIKKWERLSRQTAKINRNLDDRRQRLPDVKEEKKRKFARILKQEQQKEDQLQEQNKMAAQHVGKKIKLSNKS